MNKHGGHEDLRGSGHRSVILYIHGRIRVVVLLCVVLVGLNLS
jgi:hypothetical protein